MSFIHLNLYLFSQFFLNYIIPIPKAKGFLNGLTSGPFLGQSKTYNFLIFKKLFKLNLLKQKLLRSFLHTVVQQYGSTLNFGLMTLEQRYLEKLQNLPAIFVFIKMVKNDR